VSSRASESAVRVEEGEAKEHLVARLLHLVPKGQRVPGRLPKRAGGGHELGRLPQPVPRGREGTARTGGGGRAQNSIAWLPKPKMVKCKTSPACAPVTPKWNQVYRKVSRTRGASGNSVRS
jgi:hypothetical protein